jgi:UDP-N-acetylmuramate dehydrogenase
MELQRVFDSLIGTLGPDKVLKDEPMSLHTTFRIGGLADIFVQPGSTEDVSAAVRICREAGVPLMPLGNGSNLLVRDGGIRGAVMQLGERFANVSAEGPVLLAQGGALLSRCAAEAYCLGLCGMEFASGIPGSVGGAAAMNAGAYEGEMKDIVQAVTAVAQDGKIVRFENNNLQFTYRHSRALDEGLIITVVELALHPGDMEQSKLLLDSYTARRREKQPLEWPSAGSFFKRPPGHFAGKLISDAGLRGFAVGGAQISEKHAGFVINTGGATAADVLALAARVRERVFELYGVELEMEVRMVGED